MVIKKEAYADNIGNCKTRCYNNNTKIDGGLSMDYALVDLNKSLFSHFSSKNKHTSPLKNSTDKRTPVFNSISKIKKKEKVGLK